MQMQSATDLPNARQVRTRLHFSHVSWNKIQRQPSLQKYDQQNNLIPISFLFPLFLFLFILRFVLRFKPLRFKVLK